MMFVEITQTHEKFTPPDKQIQMNVADCGSVKVYRPL